MAINLRKVMAVVVEPQLEAMGFKFDEEHSDVFQIGYERRVGKAHEHLAFRSSIYRDSLEVSMSTNFETTGATLSELMGLEEFYWKFADEVELAAKLRELLHLLEQHGIPWLTAHGMPPGERPHADIPAFALGAAPGAPPPDEKELILAPDAPGTILPAFLRGHIRDGAVHLSMGERTGSERGKASFRLNITYYQLRQVMEFISGLELEYRAAYPEGPPFGDALMVGTQLENTNPAPTAMP